MTVLFCLALVIFCAGLCAEGSKKRKSKKSKVERPPDWLP